MSRTLKLLLLTVASVVAAGAISACGTQKISLAPTDPNYAGAVLFSQRCSGCHTIAAAATHGSAPNIRTRQLVNGPNFDTRCERPVARVLYAIENGGFSGSVMPQNVVVGQDAIEVANFVATYAGTKVRKVPGVPTCAQMPFGTLPTPTAAAPAGHATATAVAATGRKAARHAKPKSA